MTASLVLVVGALTTALVGPAAAGRPAEERTDVGRNWQQPVQDAQPNQRAVVPTDRGRRMTPAQRLSRVRDVGPGAVPAAERAGRGLDVTASGSEE